MNRIRLSAVLAPLAAATLALFSGTAFPAGSVEAGDTGSQIDSELDAALKDLVAMNGGPPGVIAVVKRGTDLKVHRFGLANVKRGTPMRAKDYMRIASVAKAFNGAVALSLVSKGILSLDDTIGGRLPDLPAAWSQVKLRELLAHTSGLPDFSQSRKFLAAVRASPTVALPPRKLLEFVEGKTLRFPPGSRYKYSNSDNIVVALMVQAVTQTTYERQLTAQVLRPLGLAETSLPSGPELPKPFIHGYDNDPAENPREDVSEAVAAGWAWASGGVVSSPEDLNEFIRGYVGGRLFDSETQAQQRVVIQGARSEPPGPGKNAAGLGIFRYDTQCGTVWGHTGNTLGYTQFAAASPNGRRSVVVSINEQVTLTQGTPGVFEALRHAEELAVCAALAKG